MSNFARYFFHTQKIIFHKFWDIHIETFENQSEVEIRRDLFQSSKESRCKVENKFFPRTQCFEVLFENSESKLGLLGNCKSASMLSLCRCFEKILESIFEENFYLHLDLFWIKVYKIKKLKWLFLLKLPQKFNYLNIQLPQH